VNAKLKYGILAFAAMIALVAIGAMGAAADPADTSSPPTEDWVFDEGKTTVLKNKVWTLEYNISVMNGSVLKIEDSTFTINGTDPWDPTWIYTDMNSSLELKSSDFFAEEGSTGFYIEAHDNITITDCEFTGLVENMMGDGGIAVYGNRYVKAEYNFVTVHETRMADGLYFENSQVKVANSEIYDIDGIGIAIFMGDNEFDQWYNVTIIDSEIHDTDNDGILLMAYTNFGHVALDCYNVDIFNSSEEGVSIDVGDHSSNDGGNGSVYATFDFVNIYNIGDQGIYMSSLYQVQGTAVNASARPMNQYDLVFINSSMWNVKNTGFYVQLVYGYTEASLTVENSDLTDISMDPEFDRLGGIWWWFQLASGGTELYVGNTTFTRCNPAAFDAWDYGGNNFHFYNTTFTENTQAGAMIEVRSGGNQSPSLFEECQFYDNEGYGIRSHIDYSWQGGQTPVHVYNSTFHDNGMAALSANSVDYGKSVGFNVTGSQIYDHESYAIEITSSYPQGPMIIHIVDTWINNTAGIKSTFSWDAWQSGAAQDILVLNSSIENSSASAINIIAKGYTAVRGSLIFVNSTINNAAGDGINFNMGSTGSKRQGFMINAYVEIVNATIENVGGIAIALSTDDAEDKGTRTFIMNNTHIYNAQRGFFNLGYEGDMWNVEIKNTLKEDVFIIGSRVEAWYCVFSKIDDRKFKALDGGQLLFFWDMNIFVRWDTGAAALGANVQIFDNKGTLIAVMNVQNPDGSLPTFTMNPFFVRETGIFASTPYVINVSFLQVSKTVGVKLDGNKDVIIVMDDHFDPEIFILYPKEGHIQQSTTLQVRGSAWDSQSGVREVLLSLDGVTWEAATGKLRWNHTFEVNDTLIGRFSGVFNLRAKAVDFANNEKVVFAQIRIDPTPPELTVDFPYDGYVTNNPELWVRGVTEVGSSIEINSIPVPVTVSMFTHMVTLVEGPNTISVISIDPLGNIQIERMTIYLDTQKPYIILISPEEEGAMTNEDTILIEAQVEEKLEISVNGYPVPYGSEWYVEDSGVMTYEVGLEPGDNVIVIQARDEADNLLVIDRIVSYDTTPPWIQVISPGIDQVLPKPEVTIVGTVDPTATLLIDGEDVTVQNGFFERVILALEGSNSIELMATDAAGNEYSEALTFWVDTIDPVVEISSPIDDSLIVNEARYILEGTTAFTDVGGTRVVSATMVLLNGEPYTYVDDGTGQVVRMDIELDPEGNFAIPVDLLEGKNEFVIEVQDDVGNKATETRMLRLDTSAPTLVMYISPIAVDEDGTIVSHAFTVNITGYTDPGSVLEVNGILLPVDEFGQFNTPFDLAPGMTTITIVSVDSAENERMIVQEIDYVPLKVKDDTEGNFGLYFLMISLVILVGVMVFAVWYVRGQREDIREMEVAEATPLAPIDDLETVIEEPDTLPGPEELEAEDTPEPGKEPAPTSAPARPRPRSPQARRAAAPRPIPKAEKPLSEDKDLSEKDAEADIGADETDQEGI
jgi:hypothetical protein